MALGTFWDRTRLRVGGQMRIASFNVENLFDRAKALDQPDWAIGRPALQAHARLNALFEEPAYGQPVKDEIVSLLEQLGLTRDDEGPFVRLRQNRGRLLRRPRAGGVDVVAGGRGDWIGWAELTTERVDELATQHTAQVITDVAPDVLAVVEAEGRTALKRFAEAGLLNAGAPRYPHVMVIDGNDDRGIDVGILTTSAFPLGSIRSHVDDTDVDGQVFSRDCPEYHLTTPAGQQVVVLANHFKSKGFGAPRQSNQRRLRQARRTAEIYRRLRTEGVEFLAVLGDLNDTPTSTPLAPLLADTDLQDISTHPNFDPAGRPGTFGDATANNKIDYILLSPALHARTNGGGMFRKGAWGGTNGTLWPIYPTITKPVHAASDHAAIFADVDLT